MTDQTPLDRIGTVAARTGRISSHSLGWLANNAPASVLADLANALESSHVSAKADAVARSWVADGLNRPMYLPRPKAQP